MTKNKQISFEVTGARDESDLSNVFILKCVLVTCKYTTFHGGLGNYKTQSK